MDGVSIVMYWTIRITIFCSVIAIMLGACSYANKKLGQEDDWWGEELLEEAIEDRIGIEIDLTPTSRE